MKRVYYFLLRLFLKKCYETKGTAGAITPKTLFFQKVLRFNRNAYWPVHFTSLITHPKNIKIGIGTAPGLSPGCYIQGGGEIYIGDYTLVAPNVGIVSANHDIYDSKIHVKGVVNIGNYCWIGMNAVILPNVTLGDFTVVGSGAVVTKSFEEGYCVIAGNPAKVIKKLNPAECVFHKNEHEYYGFVKKEKFDSFRKKHLHV